MKDYQGKIQNHLIKWVATIVLGFICLAASGQPSAKSFRLPNNITPADYDQQHVLVKLKPNHRDLFRNAAGRSAAAIPSAIGFAGSREFIPARAAEQAKSKQGPRRSVSSIDIGLYHRVRCTPGVNIEEFINSLYRTGYFEVVEPEYTNRLTYTPNDLISNQYYIETVRATEAWDINKGDEAITIAIIDSGGDLTHEDLAGNLYSNTLDPTDGIDNDNNGFIDDNQGWDFVGNDPANINDPNFLGDNSPQLISGGVGHGVNVAGCASAVADNGKGIAGVGFKTKLMFTKHSADNQLPSNGGIYLGYDGILYAAIRGANIINCSWGSSFRSEIIQDMINFITLDLGVLVVAAAGNDGLDLPFYPAAYDHVLSVAATNQNNQKATFTNYGSYVDVAAPGVSIYTTSFGSNYTTVQGTSFSSPITAGAAALVMAEFPNMTADQVSEQLRVTSNSTALNSANPGFIGQLGKGILDIKAALTTVSPSVRASQAKLLNAAGSPAQPGEKGFLTLQFKNILASTSPSLEIEIKESSPYLNILQGTIRPGAIPAGGSINNTLSPFELQIAAVVPDNVEISITLMYKDGTYVDQEVISFLMNPTFIDVDENLVTTTISNTGRIGFEDTESDTRIKGAGFVFDNNSLLYEMGIIMGTGTSALFNNVRGVDSGFDQDFISIGQRVKEITPGERSSSEIFGTLSNSSTAAAQAFQLKYRSMAWKEAPYDKFIIVEYVLSNPTAATINNFYFGLFADWDITENGGSDLAKWDNDLKMGYVYPSSASTLPHAAIQLLTGTPTYYAIDNNQAVAGNPFGLYDGFTDSEKFSTFTGPSRLEAGVSTNGNDVSHVVGSGPYTIPSGQEITIAFALLSAPTFDELQLAAAYADSIYNYTLAAPKPAIAEISTCYGSGATLTATGASQYNWYKTFTGGDAFFSGSAYSTANLFNDTTFYVSNADNTYESVRTAAKVSIKAHPGVATSGSTTICSNGSVTLSASEADTYLWSNGATTKAIEVSAPGPYTVTVGTISPVCQTTSAPVTVSTIAAPISSFTISSVPKSFSDIQFTDQSTDAVAWAWDFGNAMTSTLQNPTTSYGTAAPYEVTLQVTAANGCQDTTIQTIEIITGLEESGENIIGVYPNPCITSVFIDVGDGAMGPFSTELITAQGHVVLRQAGITAAHFEIPVGDLPNGIYVVRVAFQDRWVSRKIVKIQ